MARGIEHLSDSLFAPVLHETALHGLGGRLRATARHVAGDRFAAMDLNSKPVGGPNHCELSEPELFLRRVELYMDVNEIGARKPLGQQHCFQYTDMCLRFCWMNSRSEMCLDSNAGYVISVDLGRRTAG